MCYCIHIKNASDKITLTDAEQWRLAVDIAYYFGYNEQMPDLLSRAVKLIYLNYYMFRNEYKAAYLKQLNTKKNGN